MKRILAVALVAVAIVALAVAPAFAEGYNNDGSGQGFYTRATGYMQGPHGGYTTTTNKCQDCHSTHYAMGSFMLLRANSREAACDYCHGGGGGSSVNIMMDNTYKTNTGGAMYLDGVANQTSGRGLGTGHTLGFEGNAPGDINPAFSTTGQAFACFDCHSPHGNSARIITTIGNPGRAFGTSTRVIAPAEVGYIGSVSADGILDAANEWGIDPTHGNFKWFGDPYAAVTYGTEYNSTRPGDDTAGARLIYRPIFPKGRWLLLKDPHSTSDENGVADTVVGAVGSTVGTGALVGVNKYKIDWAEPLGVADGGYGGGQDNDSDRAFPFAPRVANQGGFTAVSEFCVDCHDGMGGASTQAANVWMPEGAYGVAYSHDTQPRH